MSPAALSMCLDALSGTSSLRPPVKRIEGLGREPAGRDSEQLRHNGKSWATQRGLMQCGSCVSAPLSSSLSICFPHSDCVHREPRMKEGVLPTFTQETRTARLQSDADV